MPAIVSHLLHTPGRITAVAGVTFTQLVRMRLFITLAVFAVLFLALQFLPYQENLGVEFAGVGQLQLIQDVAIGCMRLFGMIFCVAATALLIPRDSEDRILYTILCKPVPRFDYLAGKALGVLAVLAVMLVVMDGMMVALVQIRESGVAEQVREQLTEAGYTEQDMQLYLQQVHAAGNSLNVQVGIFSMFLGLSVLTTLTLFISCITSGAIVSMVFAFGAYFIGMFQEQLFMSISVASGQPGVSSAMQLVQQAVAVLIPDFSLFSVADELVSGEKIGVGLAGGMVLMALGYILLHLLAATWVVARKEF